MMRATVDVYREMNLIYLASKCWPAHRRSTKLKKFRHDVENLYQAERLLEAYFKSVISVVVGRTELTLL